MVISDYLKEEDIILELNNISKNEIIQELLQVAIDNKKIDSAQKDEILNALREREHKGSTGIQNGIAIPHAKTYLVKDIVIVMGLHKTGVDFKAIDKALSHIFILTISPQSDSNIYLEFLSQICNKLKTKDFRAKILNSATAKEIYQLLLE